MQADFVLYHSREKGVDFTLENIHVFSQYDTEILDLDQMLMFHLEKGYRLSGNQAPQPKSILKSDSQVSMTGRESAITQPSSNNSRQLGRESTTGSRELTIGNRSNSFSNSISKNDEFTKREAIAEREVNSSRRSIGSNLESTSSPSVNR